MNTPQKPALRPNNPRFSSGPCTKRPGWSPERAQGRAARPQSSAARDEGAARAGDHPDARAARSCPRIIRVAIVPASDTGAVEMALWSLLGPRGVDVLAWEAFSRDWVTDIVEQLKLKDVRALIAPYGELPDLAQVDFDRDVVFAWNGTTSGVRVPNADWIAGRPQRAHHLRRDLGRLRARDRLAEARCRDLLLAEGAGRRGAARHADPVAPRRASGSRAIRRPGRCRSCSA